MRNRRKRWIDAAQLVWLASGTLAAVLLVPCRLAAEELPDVLRIVTYNIQHGRGMDGKVDLPRIAEVLRGLEPHVVALQEVDQGTRRTDRVDQPAELARLTGMEVVFGRNIDYQGGGYGTAVLSKLPIRSHESVKLRSFYDPEQRGVQVLELGPEEGPRLLFLNTHLDYRPPDDERMASAATINELVADRGEQLAILAGDLNARPDTRVIREFERQWAVAGLEAGLEDSEPLLTFPASEPDRWIDYILYRPADRWELIEVRVIDEPVASDHRPMLAVLRRLE